MNTTPPFSFLGSLVNRLQPPQWLVDEGQQRLVLFLNHVLTQEQEAQDRLARKKGSVLHVRWGMFKIDLLITSAGLFDRAAPGSKPDLLVSVAADTPALVVQAVMAGKAPPVTIEGDVQLAAELGWLAENLRWDVEEDLSRVIGDIPAHALGDAARKLAAGLKQFLAGSPVAAFGAAPGGASATVPSGAFDSPASSVAPGVPKAAA